MNYRIAFYMLGTVSLMLAVAVLAPFGIALGLHETGTALAFGVMFAIFAVLGGLGLLIRYKSKNKVVDNINAKSGILTVGICWVVISFIGTIPYMLSQYEGIANFADALFESISGFTTTGASLIVDATTVPASLALWRGLSQWIGGMGILVLVTALLGKDQSNSSPIFNAEMPGPIKGKLVSKLRYTARILYSIYIVMTLIEFLLLYIGTLTGQGNMTAFECLIHSLTTASTGGFSTQTASIGAYASLYYEIITGIFMVLFMVNFNIFYLILVGKALSAFKDEEVRTMFTLIILFILGVSVSLFIHNTYSNFAECLRYASFQIVSCMSTTGYATADIYTWPLFAQILIIGIMMVGGCAGSTAGGLKVMRFTILTKSGFRSIRTTAFPKHVSIVKFNGKPLEDGIVQGIKNYFLIYIIIFIASMVLLAMFSPDTDFMNIIISVTSALDNVGPGHFAELGVAQKLVLCFDMLAGRLELFPMLMLFYPRAWKKF